MLTGMENVNVRIDAELLAAIDAEAKRIDRPRSWVIRRSLERDYGDTRAERKRAGSQEGK